LFKIVSEKHNELTKNMIQQKTILRVADNSGVKKVKCLAVLGGLKKKTGKLGEIIVVSVLNFRQVKKKNDITKLKKGDVFLAVIVRLKRKGRKKDGLNLFFYENSVCLLNKPKKNLVATRILGPLPREIKLIKPLQISTVSTAGFC